MSMPAYLYVFIYVPQSGYLKWTKHISRWPLGQGWLQICPVFICFDLSKNLFLGLCARMRTTRAPAPNPHDLETQHRPGGSDSGLASPWHPASGACHPPAYIAHTPWSPPTTESTPSWSPLYQGGRSDSSWAVGDVGHNYISAIITKDVEWICLFFLMNCFGLFIRGEPSNLFFGCLETLSSVLYPFTATISSLLFSSLSARLPSLYVTCWWCGKGTGPTVRQMRFLNPWLTINESNECGTQFNFSKHQFQHAKIEMQYLVSKWVLSFSRFSELTSAQKPTPGVCPKDVNSISVFFFKWTHPSCVLLTGAFADTCEESIVNQKITINIGTVWCLAHCC